MSHARGHRRTLSVPPAFALGRRVRRVALVGLVTIAQPMGWTLSAQAQVRAMPQFETRLDAVVTPGGGMLAGVGVNRRFGWYARGGATLGAGVVRSEDGWAAMHRLEVVSRFLFDPFGEYRRGVYGGAGVAIRHLAGDATRPELVLLVGVEGPRAGKAPIRAVELSLGGGVRLGVVWRRQRPVGR